MNKSKPFDERQINLFRVVCTRLYLLTLLFLWGDMMYRKLALGQSSSEHEDLAIILTANALILIGTFVWNMGFAIKMMKLWKIIGLYILMLALGSGLIYIQYGIEDIDLFWNKIGITATILAIMAVVYGIFALIGYKKAEKEISD